MLQASTTRVCHRACPRPDHEVGSDPAVDPARDLRGVLYSQTGPMWATLQGHRMDTGNRGVNDPRTRAGRGSSRQGGVVHATVPLPSQPEPLSGAAENAAPSVARHTLQLLAPRSICAGNEAIPISRQLFGDRPTTDGQCAKRLGRRSSSRMRTGEERLLRLL
jgi:hypothetical protein